MAGRNLLKGEREAVIKSTMPVIQESIESPISVGERAKLSFGNSEGNKNYLSRKFGKENVAEIIPNKFAIKKDEKWYAIDPVKKSVKDIPGDIADIVGDIPEIVGFGIVGGLGALGGSPAGPAGMAAGSVAGAGVGSALGVGIKQTIGSKLGTYEASLKERLKEQATAGAYGAGTQAVFGMLGKIAKTFGKALLETPRIVSGISDETLKRTIEKDISNILSPEKVNPGFLAQVSERVQLGLKDLHQRLNMQWKKVVDDTLKKNPRIQINFANAVQNFQNNMVDAGLITPKGKITLRTKLDPAARKKLENFFTYINQTVRKKPTMSFQNAMRLKDDIWRLSEQLDPSEARIAKKLYKDISSQMGETIPGLKPINKKLSEFFSIEDYLKPKMGMTRTAQGLERLDITIEPVSQLKNFLKKGATERRVLEELEKRVAPQYKFIDDFLDGVAAQEWTAHSSSILQEFRKTVGKMLFDVGEVPVGIARGVGELAKPLAPVGASIKLLGSKVPRFATGAISQALRLEPGNLRDKPKTIFEKLRR